MVNIWVAVGIGIVALFIGFEVGRSVRGMVAETEGHLEEMEKRSLSGKKQNRGRRGGTGKEGINRTPAEWIIYSPVSGDVTCFYENNMCRVSVLPEQERLYAPVSGRVKKLYPMGNSMLIVSDFGVELLVNVARGADELCNGYFRPRVVQSEVISKGKLLLEFDRAGLEKDGADVTIDIVVEQFWKDKSVAVIDCERVKAGDALLWV